MPYKKPQIEKLYYSIGEVAKMFDVSVTLIRFWEKEFDILKPKKNAKGNRLFTKTDVDNLHLIFHLVKENGLTLNGAKMKLRDNKNDISYNLEIISKLSDIKNLLLDMRESL